MITKTLFLVRIIRRIGARSLRGKKIKQKVQPGQISMPGNTRQETHLVMRENHRAFCCYLRQNGGGSLRNGHDRTTARGAVVARVTFRQAVTTGSPPRQTRRGCSP
jgi:hypothetical protein